MLRPIITCWCKRSLKLIGDPGVLLQGVCRPCLKFSICQKCDSIRQRLCMSRMTKYRVWKVNEPEEEECSLSCEASRGSVVAAPSRRQIVGGLLCVRRQGGWKMFVLVQDWNSEVFTCYFHSEQQAHWYVLACTEVWSCWVHYRCCTHPLVIKDSALWCLKEMFLFTLLICFIPPHSA